MFLKKIKSSSLAEVVIALTVIAICFGVASIVFIRSIKVTTNFQDVRKQTQIKSMLWGNLLSDDDEFPEIENVWVTQELDQNNDSLIVFSFASTTKKTIWRQQWLKYER
tara:strand:- start:5654 stop:5980 length:327 start_codon:yes stop_codon:yes gene_type:complete